MWRHRVRRSLLLALLAAGPVCAQESSPLGPGSRVRLRLLPHQAADRERPQLLRGTLTAVGRDTLVLRLHSQVEPVALPRAWVEWVEVSGGRASALEGALEGAASGALLGAALGAMIGAEVANSTEEPFARTVLTRAAVYGFSLGATNALLRAIRPGEKWRRVPTRADLAAGVAERRVVLALAWSG